LFQGNIIMGNSQNPFFSIIIALYNKEYYIEETIKSVTNQSCNDWELIIVDNGSTDSSWELTQSLAKSQPKITAIRFTIKQGPGACRNHGLNRASGKWILFLDADDLIKENYLEIRKQFIQLHPTLEILVSRWLEFYNNNPKDVKIFTPSGWNNSTNIEEISIGYTPWILHAAIINKKLFTKAKRWVEELDLMASEDTAFWFRITQGANIGFINDDGALYRILSNSRNNPSIEKWIADVAKVIDNNVRYIQKNRITPKQYETLFRVHERLYLLSLKNNLTSNMLEYKAIDFLKKSANNPTILLRKILGFKIFAKLKHVLHKSI
jgi:glycosyltransferase involved in cell wall biosynthesis